MVSGPHLHADLEVQVFILTESIPQLEAIIFTSYMAGVINQGEVTSQSTGGPIATMGRYNKEGALYINLIDTKTQKSAWLAMGRDSLPNGGWKLDEIRSEVAEGFIADLQEVPQCAKKYGRRNSGHPQRLVAVRRAMSYSRRRAASRSHSGSLAWPAA